jgi:hypothetical protein
MIVAILGHTTLAEAERYTEEADQAGLAEAAVSILEGASGTESPKPHSRWEARRKRTEIQNESEWDWRSLGDFTGRVISEA